jgi:uncharacterized membrane protein YdbT with pleckstrin-like domain
LLGKPLATEKAPDRGLFLWLKQYNKVDVRYELSSTVMIQYNQEQKQPTAYFWYMLTQAAIPALILIAIGVAMDPGGIVTTVALVVFAAGAILAAINYHFTLYTPGDQSITIKSGLIFRKTVSINYVRVQNADVSRGPLQMLFGIATLNLWTASPGQVQTVSDNRGNTHSVNRPEGRLVLLRADAEECKNKVTAQGAVQQVVVTQAAS